MEEAMDLQQDNLYGSNTVYVTTDSKGYVMDSVLLGYNVAFMGNWI